ncbi:hypothetical protein JOC78_002039 [Bacillus ectoiniformans]|uniref:hypothetical protein n=1 Tax=Bacillus ectoiniformans TaxID=1494429 RepID=UPI00195DCEF0|nr:hypothetical protein [Bacillus ectoiniformans]MBM7649086.1 hypothetical protein [Bacillus ectoiniformans]
MTANYLKVMLETLCYFNQVEILHTYKKNGEPYLTIRCVKNTSTIQVEFIQSHIIQQYDSIKEAESAIKKVIN